MTVQVRYFKMESQSNNGGKFKKKKKMSYMQKMRKFGKSGRFGQGRQVDKETYDYFLRVMEANRNGDVKDQFLSDLSGNIMTCDRDQSVEKVC